MVSIFNEAIFDSDEITLSDGLDRRYCVLYANVDPCVEALEWLVHDK